MPKLSVIIPIYNVEKYLDCCIMSVINQTLKDIEIILVDDESPDNCPQICEKYICLDNRIKVIHKKNQGLGLARNTGIEIATGKYITFLDSDDIIDLSAYEHLCKYLNSYSLDVIYFKFERFVCKEKIQPTLPIESIHLYQGKHIKELMLDFIASAPTAKIDHEIECSSCTAIYRTDIIRKNNILYHSERELISEDLIFNLDYLTCTNKVGINPSKYYKYRTNTHSLTNSIRTDRIDKNIILYQYINDHLWKWGLDNRAFERNQRLFIGNSRNSINMLLESKYKNKVLWLNHVLSYSIWRNIHSTYKWKKLPLYPRLFFRMCYYKNYRGLIFITYLRKITKWIMSN